MSPLPSLFPSSSVEVCRLKRSLNGLKQAPRAWCKYPDKNPPLSR
jgi:hypothetical protein